jgi:DUF4097 and DUF4098 domain-containing protein YvlB
MVQEKWLVEDEKVIDIERIRTLKVGLIAGQVDIVGHDEPGARVEVHSVRGKALKVSIDGDTLEIDHPQLGWDNFIEVFKSFRGSASADISIMVPRDVVVDNHRGDLELNAVSGEISVRNHTGRIVAHTVSGDVTATGEIASFASDGVSGNVFLDLAGIPDEVRVNTVSGDVTVRLEPDVPAQYKINTVSGKLQLDDAEITGVRGGYTGKFGVLEQQWLEFRANTVSGNVSVLHAVSA